ncbi:DHH phosphoesterase [Obba rivulosa]|uniref:DHH phosphoesterase n=1 Tax=Obba rivulosa TaxID=1052685 RepID=A0A8E2AUP7_9APHY|nr:DHH phosphoesterase [Obba rivulosa]
MSTSRKRPHPQSRSSSTSSSSPQLRGCSPSIPAQQWPASTEALEAARSFLKECVSMHLPTLLVPDKDADGLCGGLIVYRTLVHMGLSPSLIAVHFVKKGSNIHEAEEGRVMEKYGARYAVVIDQGSRSGPRLIGGDTKTLVVDHHWSEEFPEGATVLSSAKFPPIATSSTLAYTLCLPLLASGATGSSGAKSEAPMRETITQLEYLCVMGTMGDLGTSFRWELPFPDMQDCLKRCTKKALGEAVSLINAPRRTSKYDIETAWSALLGISSPKDFMVTARAFPPLSSSTLQHVKRLHEARADVRAETEHCSHSAPSFSGDGKVALIRISSAAQVHPLIATRWAGTLKSARLQIVMCANDGYLEGQNMTNFSCRTARGNIPKKNGCNQKTEENVDIIALLKSYAAQVPGLRESMGENFARGHKEASGGIVRTEDFERLWAVMLNSKDPQVGESPNKKRKVSGKRKDMPKQSNTLESWVRRE